MALRAEGASVAKQADLLAETKAMKVSISHPGVVLGCDQMLDLDGQGLDKVSTRDEAADILRRLRGKTHILQSRHRRLHRRRAGVAAPVAAAPARAELLGRLPRDTISTTIGDAAFESVGCYQLEGLGAQLFDRIDGDYFSILGMPLLPLLQWLRDRGSLQP